MKGCYKYILGKNESKGYINSYSDLKEMTDIDDFDLFGTLIIQRTDEMEMKKDEIEDIRKEFFYDPDMEEFLFSYSIYSVYKDKKLYFLLSEKENGVPFFSSEEELLRFIDDSFNTIFLAASEKLMHNDHKLIKRNLGFDLLYKGSDPTELHRDERGMYVPYIAPDIALVCIYDFDKEFNLRSVTEEELRNILQNTVEINNENKLIILYYVELSKDAMEYAKSQNIAIKYIIDILKDVKMSDSRLNDANVLLPEHNMTKEEVDELNKGLDELGRRLGLTLSFDNENKK